MLNPKTSSQHKAVVAILGVRKIQTPKAPVRETRGLAAPLKAVVFLKPDELARTLWMAPV